MVFIALSLVLFSTLQNKNDDQRFLSALGIDSTSKSNIIKSHYPKETGWTTYKRDNVLKVKLFQTNQHFQIKHIFVE